jgi:hypothetical protein
VSHPLILRRFIAMCCPCGRELCTSRQLKAPSTPPQSAASPYRRKVIGSRLGSGVGHSSRMVGDGNSWQLYPSFTQRAPNSTPRHHHVAGCPVPDPLQKSSRLGGVEEGKGCSEEDLSHLINTSRRPGGGLEGHALAAERQTEDKLSPRTSSENISSRHSGE